MRDSNALNTHPVRATKTDIVKECIVPDGGGGPLDRILTSLKKPRRRYLLYYLNEQEHAHIAESAQYIAACEWECELEDIPAEAHENVKIDLFHVHLPYLADFDLIEYDPQNGDIRFRDPPDKLLEFLDLAKSTEDIDLPDIDSN